MPRARRVTAPPDDGPLVDQPLPGTEDLGQDPAPHNGRPRRARTATKATGNRGKIAARTATGKMMSKAQMVEKVAGEIHLYLGLFASGFEAMEQTRYGESCISEVVWGTAVIPAPGGPVEVERLAGIAERLTAMIARNDKMLARAATTGIIGDIAMMLHLAWPIGRAMWVHHGPMGTGHGTVDSEAKAGEYAAKYPAFTGS